MLAFMWPEFKVEHGIPVAQLIAEHETWNKFSVLLTEVKQAWKGSVSGRVNGFDFKDKKTWANTWMKKG